MANYPLMFLVTTIRFNIGFTLTGAKVDDGMDIGSMFQLGYQF
jgi:hypothetical protein